MWKKVTAWFLAEDSESLQFGFLKIKQDVALNEMLWFNVISQSVTSGALIQAVMETVENWQEIREEFWMGKMMLWLATQPHSMYLDILNLCSCWLKDLQEVGHQLQGENFTTNRKGCGVHLCARGACKCC
jgi:hypothetical protein